MNQKQTIWLLSALAALLVTALALRAIPLPDAAERLESFPSKGPGFTSRDAPLTEIEKEALGPAVGMKRLYAWRGRSYALTILDGTRNRNAAHDPRYCFRGAGWRITKESRVPIPGGSARRVWMSNRDGNSEALVFYSTGIEAFDDPKAYWLRATKRRWLRGLGGPEPVLVTIQPVNSGETVEGLAEGLLPLLPLP